MIENPNPSPTPAPKTSREKVITVLGTTATLFLAIAVFFVIASAPYVLIEWGKWIYKSYVSLFV